jgi:hypothetical protein
MLWGNSKAGERGIGTTPRQYSKAFRARGFNADDWLSLWKPHPLTVIQPRAWLNGASAKVKALGANPLWNLL